MTSSFGELYRNIGIAHFVLLLTKNRIDRILNEASCLRVWNTDQEKITSFLTYSTFKQRWIGELTMSNKMIQIGIIKWYPLQCRQSYIFSIDEVNTYTSMSPDSDTRNQYLKLFRFMLYIYMYNIFMSIYLSIYIYIQSSVL